MAARITSSCVMVNDPQATTSHPLQCGLREELASAREEIAVLKGLLGNHALATGESLRAILAILRRHDSDIAALKGDTDPCPGDGPLPPNGSAE